jgi:aquaporin Z
MEAVNLGLFMISACVFATLLEHPRSELHMWIESAFTRRVLMGIAMGLTAIGIIHTPFGKRSGAHMNPALTLTYWSLGKIEPLDAGAYVLFQFVGGIVGVLAAWLLIGEPLAHSAVNFIVTVPGPQGVEAAALAEAAISFGLMLAVLVLSNSRSLSRLTPLAAGTLLALYITFEAPVSGMSMNPARTLGSAVVAVDYSWIWIYFLAPPAGMFLAGQVYRFSRGLGAILCVKLHHDNPQPCIFCGKPRERQFS